MSGDRKELLEALAQARARMQEIADAAKALQATPDDREARWALEGLQQQEERAQNRAIHALDVADLVRHRAAIEEMDQARWKASQEADALHREEVEAVGIYRRRHLALAEREVQALERIATAMETKAGLR